MKLITPKDLRLHPAVADRLHLPKIITDPLKITAALVQLGLMAGWTDAEEQNILDHFTGKASWSSPANLFISLSTTTPTEAGGNFTEPGAGAYARVSTAPADWNAAAGTAPVIADNANVITFPTATASWGTVTHFGAHSLSAAGVLWAWGALGTSKLITTDDTASFAAGVLDFKLGDPGDSY